MQEVHSMEGCPESLLGNYEQWLEAGSKQYTQLHWESEWDCGREDEYLCGT